MPGKQHKFVVSFMGLPIIFFMLSFFFHGCKTAPADMKEENRQLADQKIAAVDEMDLENAEYHSLSAYKGKIKLHRGIFRKRISENSSSEMVTALSQYTAVGKLDRKREGAAVVLITMPGDVRLFHDLAVFVKKNGKPVNVATVFLGDRIIIKSISIENGYIVVNMIKHNRNDLMCCPTSEVIRKYALRKNKLVLASNEQKH